MKLSRKHTTLSASLRPGAAFVEVQKKIEAQMARLTAASSDFRQIPMVVQQLAFSLTRVPEADALLAQTPPGMSRAMMEGNAGLLLGLNVHRYGPQREVLAKALSKVSSARVHQVSAKYLTEEKRGLASIGPMTRLE